MKTSNVDTERIREFQNSADSAHVIVYEAKREDSTYGKADLIHWYLSTQPQSAQ